MTKDIVKYYSKHIQTFSLFLLRMGEKDMIKYSRDTRTFAYSLIYHYAKFDKMDRRYNININDVPEFDLCELSARIMIDNPGYDSESTGPDNPHYESKMIPALLSYFRKSTDKDAQSDFLEAWRTGIVEYHHNSMCEVLDEQLIEYNDVHGCVNPEDPGPRRWFGNVA